jgi:DNA-binding transcriptional LysR family regulator
VQLEPQQCRMLVMIADTGSISSAARALGVGQDKLALQLAQIEVLCGFRVFERDARGARVTEQGRTALRRARAACQPHPGAPQAREPQAVRLAGSPGILDQLLPDLVHHLGDTRWTATTGSDADVVHGLRNGRFDLALLVRWPHVAYLPREGLVRRQVGEAPLRALLPAGAHTPVGLGELADRPWVLRADPDARSAVLAECARARITPEVRFVVDEPAAVAALAASGEAVAIEPVLAAPAGVTAVPYTGARPFRLELLHLRHRRDAPGRLPDLLDAVAYAVTSRADLRRAS